MLESCNIATPQSTAASAINTLQAPAAGLPDCRKARRRSTRYARDSPGTKVTAVFFSFFFCMERLEHAREHLCRHAIKEPNSHSSRRFSRNETGYSPSLLRSGSGSGRHGKSITKTGYGIVRVSLLCLCLRRKAIGKALVTKQLTYYVRVFHKL